MGSSRTPRGTPRNSRSLWFCHTRRLTGWVPLGPREEHPSNYPTLGSRIPGKWEVGSGEKCRVDRRLEDFFGSGTMALNEPELLAVLAVRPVSHGRTGSPGSVVPARTGLVTTAPRPGGV